jgi:hypothetical protein
MKNQSQPSAAISFVIFRSRVSVARSISEIKVHPVHSNRPTDLTENIIAFHTIMYGISFTGSSGESIHFTTLISASPSTFGSRECSKLFKSPVKPLYDVIRSSLGLDRNADY